MTTPMQISKMMKARGVRACVSVEPLPRAWHRSELSAVFPPGEATLAHWSILWGAHTFICCEYFQVSFSCRFIIHSLYVPSLYALLQCMWHIVPARLFLHWCTWWIQFSTVTLSGVPLPHDKCKKNLAFFVWLKRKLLFSNEVWTKLVLLAWAF